MCADHYQLSPNWENKFKIVIPTEEDLLSKSLYSNILRLKRLYLLEEIKLLELLLDGEDEAVDDMEILTQIMEKKTIEMGLAKELGAVLN